MKDKPYYLVVGDDPNAKGGNGKKYPTYEDALEAAKNHLRQHLTMGNRSGVLDGYHICVPVTHVRPSTPPVIIEEL
jgi:hypothetical protein